MAKNLIFGPSSAMVVCPYAMTDGVARLAELFGPLDGDLSDTLTRLSSRDPTQAWTSGQWMTERTGGSDVSRTETVATPVPGTNATAYTVDGFKWFSSATDSDVCALLAKVDGKLTCFMGRVAAQTKGAFPAVKIHRLKQKFGTVAVPTAELELRGMKVQQVGPVGRGVATIATVLNITRIHSSIGSLGCMRRAFHIAREYAVVRRVFGQRLCDIPAHVKVLASQEVLGRGLLFLNLYTCSLMGCDELGNPKYAVEHAELLRVAPGICKAVTCKAAVPAISECMEALGGLGYLEHDVEFNVARLLRDAQVNPIWEGTTNTLAADFVRHVRKRGASFAKGMNAFLTDKLEQTPATGILGGLAGKVERDWSALKTLLFSSNTAAVDSNAREYMLEFGRLMICALLISAASAAKGSDSTEAIEVAARWVCQDLTRAAIGPFPAFYEAYRQDVPEGKTSNVHLVEKGYEGL